MSRIRHVLMTALAIFSVSTAAMASADGQPPRRDRYPSSSRSAADNRYALSAYGGFMAFQFDSGLFRDNEVDFGIADGDFSGGRFGLELDFAVLPMLDVSVGYSSSSGDVSASYLDFTYDDGREIEHGASLRTTEMTVAAKFRLARAPARFRPYLLAGASGTFYRYREDGEFINFDTSDIYFDSYEERSFLPGFFAGVGTDFRAIQAPDGRQVDLFGEFRYARSQGDHQDDFDGFGGLTIGRTGGLFGVRIRF